MRDKTGLPIHYDHEVDHDLPRRLYGGWFPDEGHRALVRAMTLSERGMVESRAAALELALMPFDERDRVRIEAAVLAMFNGFRAMRQQGEDAEATAQITLAVLREFPAWAIERGCMKIARHEVGLDSRWAPNDGQIADVVREIVRPYATALASAQGLMAAPVKGAAAIAPPSRENRPTYDELVERCRRDGLMIGPKEKPDPVKAGADFRAAHGVSQEAWDAIPDAHNG